MKKDGIKSLNKHIGFYGERMAAEYLLLRGYTVLEKNYRSKEGEIDIIASYGDEIIFVEVKTRCSLKYGQLEETINKQKQRKLYRVACYYLYQKGIKHKYRFDALLLLLDEDYYHIKRIMHIKNAF